MTADRTAILAAALATVFACGSENPQTSPTDPCFDGSCDLPSDPTERSCTLRRKDAFNPNQMAFTKSALRWSCADVDGVTGDDRGQEYCEYFALVQLPATETTPEPQTQVLGRLNRHEPEDPDAEGAETTYDTTPVKLPLGDDEITALEDDLDAVVGQCVFTTWNSDFPGPVPACDPEIQSDGCPEVLGLPIEEENFRMKFDVNSVDAARFLVEDCMCAYQPAEDCLGPDIFEGDPEDSSDRRHDDFFRGCMLNADLNETEFRKSDTTVCAASIRMAECGCTLNVDDPELTLAKALSPWDRRGFVLGTWSGQSELPPGCRHIELGDASQTVVTCDLSASEVLAQSMDLKQLCREKYGPNVVVHVPIPPELIECDADATGSLYAGTCSDTPWVVTEQSSYPSE